MLETFTSISSSYFIHSSISTTYTEDICCPIPRRTSSPVLASWPQRKAEEYDLEACKELKEILLSPLPLEQDKESIRTHPQILKLKTPFDPTISPVKNFRVMHDVLLDSSDSDDSCESYLPNEFCRPVLGNSTSNLPRIVPDRSEPLLTPPLRSHNPLPMNSPFMSKRKMSSGPELDILSVSPPRPDDENTLLRRARVKSKRVNNTLSTQSLTLKNGSVKNCPVVHTDYHESDLFDFDVDL